jgi:hypothetical protein
VITVLCTPADIPVTVDGDGGSDVINVGGSLRSGSLNGINGPLTVHGDHQRGDFDRLYIWDQSSGPGHIYSVSATAVTREVTPVNYDTLDYLEVHSSNSDDWIFVTSTAAGTPVTINNGAGADVITVGNPIGAGTYTLAGLQSPLTITGVSTPAGHGALFIKDTGAGSGQNYGVSSAAVTRGGITVNYSHLESLELDTSPYHDTIALTGQAAGTAVAINSGDGADTINVSVASGSAYANVVIDGGPQTGSLVGDILNVTDTSGGAVVHIHPAAPGAGSVDVHYLGGPVSTLTYQNIEGTTQNPDAGQSYIQALFHTVLNRNSTATEMNHWLLVLNQQGRYAVAVGIELSQEACSNKVKAWFQTYFPQVPVDLATWAPYLQTHSEEQTLAAMYSQYVVFSPNQQVALGQEMTFIYSSYQQFLGRAPNSVEVGNAFGLLGGGQPAGAVVYQLLTTHEYRQAVVAEYITTLYHRPAKSGEVVQLESGGLDLRNIRELMESSQEFYDSGF